MSQPFLLLNAYTVPRDNRSYCLLLTLSDGSYAFFLVQLNYNSKSRNVYTCYLSVSAYTLDIDMGRMSGCMGLGLGCGGEVGVGVGGAG
jgi:hypothetical protein